MDNYFDTQTHSLHANGAHVNNHHSDQDKHK